MKIRSLYRYIALAAFILTLFISASYTTNVSAQSSNSNICLATVETGTGQGRFSVAGQGKFSVAGQGRFSVAGQEGPDGTLDIGDGNLTEAEINEILNNVIDSRWLIEEVLAYPDLGEQRVAILVVDDFTDFSLTLEEIYALDPDAESQVEQYYGELGKIPDPSTLVKTVPHGETVVEVIETLITDVELEVGPLNIDVVPVDISVNGQYRLDLMTSALQQAIFAALENGYSNIVVNMSFGFIPCTDNSWGPAFNFESFLDTRYQEIIFDVDGGTDVEGEIAPTFYNDFGMQQYFSNYLDIPVEESGEYLAYLFNSITIDADDEGMTDFNNLIAYWTNEAANSGGDFSFLPVASSGNYRDFYEANGVLPEPLAPAQFPQIFAASATLGMNGRIWEYSQDGSMILPGAWWHFGDGSYRAGTSYAAPYLSAIGALYLTSDNPPACDFKNGLPLAGDKVGYFDGWNNSLFSDGRLLCYPNPTDVEPTPEPTTETPTPEPTTETPTPEPTTETPTPEPTTETPTPEPTTETPTPEPTTEPTPTGTITELVINGGFEEFVKRTQPIGWKVVKQSRDKVVCNKDKDGDGIPDKIFAHSGDCAWRFKGVPGERTKLIQRYDMAEYGLDIGDGFRLEVFAESNIVPRAVAKVKVVFLNNSKKVEKFRFPETNGYKRFVATLLLERSDVDFVKLIFINKTPTKRLHIDDVSLKLYQEPDVELLPMPEPPPVMRN